jgi:hypothetical protein
MKVGYTDDTEIRSEIITQRVQQYVLQDEVSDTDLRQLEDELDMQVELLQNKKNAGFAAFRQLQLLSGYDQIIE